MNLTDSLSSASAPPWELELVVMVTSENPSIFPDNVNALAPFELVVLVTIYSKIIILPSSNFLPVTPSPKYILNLPSSTSSIK